MVKTQSNSSSSKSGSATGKVVMGVLLVFVGGPILSLSLHALLTPLLGDPAAGTSGRGFINIAMLFAWPVALIGGLTLIIIGLRNKRKVSR